MIDLSRIGIIGATPLGVGLAELAAQNGLSVLLIDNDKGNLERGVQVIRESVDGWIREGRVKAEQKEEVMGRVQLALDYEVLKTVDFVFEAQIDSEFEKMASLRKCEEVLKPSAIFAIHSDTLSITKLSGDIKNPERILGIHFLTPVTSSRLVEIIRGVKTSEASLQGAVEVIKKLGREFIVVPDFPGYVVNRVMASMINEAVGLLYEGISSSTEIDKALSAGLNLKVGPLALADIVGLDTLLDILKTLYREYGHAKYVASPLLVKYVEAGYLGRKTGKGFYEY